jgi:sugar lactone lactonase YvrE
MPDGLYWVAVYRGGKIAAYRPDGSLERTIAMPVPLVSSVAFGGPALDRLYVTTIAHDVAAGGDQDHGTDDQAGSLFVIEGLGTRGRAEPEFAG